MLFKNNAAIGAKYFKKPLGVLKPGAAADVIVMDYKPFTPFSDENIDGHMLFGMMGKNCPAPPHHQRQGALQGPGVRGDR